MTRVPGRSVVEFCVQKNGFQNLRIWKYRYVTTKPLEIQIQNVELLITFSRPLFDEDSIALVSAAQRTLWEKLQLDASISCESWKKGHRSEHNCYYKKARLCAHGYILCILRSFFFFLKKYLFFFMRSILKNHETGDTWVSTTTGSGGGGPTWNGTPRWRGKVG